MELERREREREDEQGETRFVEQAESNRGTGSTHTSMQPAGQRERERVRKVGKVGGDQVGRASREQQVDRKLSHRHTSD